MHGAPLRLRCENEVGFKWSSGSRPWSSCTTVPIWVPVKAATTRIMSSSAIAPRSDFRAIPNPWDSTNLARLTTIDWRLPGALVICRWIRASCAITSSRDALGRASRVINCADSELYESVRTAACKKLRLAVCNDREEQRR